MPNKRTPEEQQKLTPETASQFVPIEHTPKEVRQAAERVARNLGDQWEVMKCEVGEFNGYILLKNQSGRGRVEIERDVFTDPSQGAWMVSWDNPRSDQSYTDPRSLSGPNVVRVLSKVEEYGPCPDTTSHYSGLGAGGLKPPTKWSTATLQTTWTRTVAPGAGYSPASRASQTRILTH